MGSAKCQVPSAKCQVPSAKCQVPSAKCQVPSAKCQVPSAEAGEASGAGRLKPLQQPHEVRLRGLHPWCGRTPVARDRLRCGRGRAPRLGVQDTISARHGVSDGGAGGVTLAAWQEDRPWRSGGGMHRGHRNFFAKRPPSRQPTAPQLRHQGDLLTSCLTLASADSWQVGGEWSVSRDVLFEGIADHDSTSAHRLRG